MQLILASTSVARRSVLEAAGVEVRCEAPGVDELAVHDSDPVRLARTLALAKAHAVAARYPDALVLGADQVAVDPDHPAAPFGKPADADDHLARLKLMRGRPHVLVTGFAFVGPGEAVEVGHEQTVLRVRADLDDAELAAYVHTGEGAGCAGGYRAEGKGAFLFEVVEGDWFNVLGLPLLRVFDVLRRHGWRYGA